MFIVNLYIDSCSYDSGGLFHERKGLQDCKGAPKETIGIEGNLRRGWPIRIISLPRSYTTGLELIYQHRLCAMWALKPNFSHQQRLADYTWNLCVNVRHRVLVFMTYKPLKPHIFRTYYHQIIKNDVMRIQSSISCNRFYLNIILLTLCECPGKREGGCSGSIRVVSLPRTPYYYWST